MQCRTSIAAYVHCGDVDQYLSTIVREYRDGRLGLDSQGSQSVYVLTDLIAQLAARQGDVPR
jgi:hypothetical protein